MIQYLTVQGDTFDIIAKKHYGDETLLEELIKANIELVDYVVFPAGEIINIPEVVIESKPSVGAPPWRR